MRLLSWVLLALFTLYLLAVNRSYSFANTRPPTYDDAWFLESSLHLYRELTSSGVKAFAAAYAGSFRTKAPLIAVLPLPFYLLWGTSQQTAMLVNSLFIVITNIYLFLLVRRLFSPEAALAAVVFYQTMPLAYGVSRVFMADYGLAALVIAWLYYLVASERLTRGSANFAMGVLLGLGLLMKILFPAFIAGPLLAVMILRRRQAAPAAAETRWLWGACASRPLLAIALPGVAIAATWYAFHLGTILRYAWQGAYGEIGEQYGAGGLMHWAWLFVNRGLSAYYAIAIAALGLAALVLNRKRLRWGEREWLLAGWLVPPLLATAGGQNREIRFVIALLPVFAILLAVSVFHLGERPAVQAALAVLVVIFPQRLFAELSYRPDPHSHSHPVEWGPLTLYSRDLGWARAPSAEGQWNQQRILEALRQLSLPSSRPRYAVVAVEHPYLNANLLSYFNAYSQYPLRFTSLGYAETSPDQAVDRIWQFDARFLILQHGLHDHDLPMFLNRVNAEIAARLERGELPFRLRAKVSLTQEVKALIYQREAPWTRFAVGTPWTPPAHPLTVDFTGGARFLGYEWTPAGPHLWRLVTYWTAPHQLGEDYLLHVELRRAGHVAATEETIGGGRHPFYEWTPGEVIRQSLMLYTPDGRALEARLWLSAWGLGDPHRITAPPELVHASVIPLQPPE